MVAIIKNDTFSIDVIEDAVHPRPVQVILRFGDDNKSDFHTKSTKRCRGQKPSHFFFRSIKDNRKIDITIFAVVAARTRTEQDHLKRI
jgi:hypothetical protein